MPRVLHNTLGCHPLLHTEAHESTHLCASLTRSRAHAQNIVDEHEASPLAPPRPDLPGPGAAS
eukprot:752552-Prymnesium_polylepis.1